MRDSKSADPSRTGKMASALRSLPPDCQRILIVGAGGFGREVLQWARDAWPESTDRIAGFLSSDADSLKGLDCGHRVLGSPDAYRPAAGDRLLLAIGIPYARRRVAELLIAYGAEFLTLIHPTAIVAASASIGPGVILCPYSIASDSCRVGPFVIMNYHSSLGHDASAGDFSVLSPYATLGGHAHIEDDVFLGLHSSVGPGKTVGARSKVSANSCVLASTPPDSIIWGSPGTVRPRQALVS
jgi:sugar O-acyltransferase (sialic acid O-acetyltransferase NeuD family)